MPVASDQRTNNGLIDSIASTYQKCLLIAPLSPEIVMAAFRYGAIYDIDPELLLAIAFVESSFNPFARNMQSHGLLQINCKVWRKAISLDMSRIYEINYNMDKGAFILKHYIIKSGDVWKAVHWFNNGPSGKYNNRRYAVRVRAVYEKLT